MKKLLKKIILSILVFLTIFVSFAPYSTAKAQTWYNSNPFEWYLKVYDEDASPPTDIFGERYTAAQVQWVLYSVFSTIFTMPLTLIGAKPTAYVCIAKLAMKIVSVDDCLGGFKDTLDAIVNNVIAIDTKIDPIAITPPDNGSFWHKTFVEDRPLSGITYVKKIGRKLRLVPEVTAAESYGYNRLEIVQDLWAISRNIAYSLFVLIIIAASFMIMFKVKISPQATVTIQVALPKIAITLILVTFSYAIAGFVIDLVYVVMGLFSMFMPNPSLAYGVISGSIGKFAVDGLLVVFVYSVVYIILYLIVTIAATFVAILNLNLASVLIGLIMLIFSIFLLIILIINIFRSLFALFKALAGVYVSVIVAPLQLALGALPTPPNQQSGSAFGGWLKTLISHAAVFPVAGICYYLAFLFLIKANSAIWSGLGASWGEAIASFMETLHGAAGIPPGTWDWLSSGANAWGPPLLGNASAAGAIAFILVSVGCIMAIPKVSKIIEGALAGRPFDLGSESVKI